MTTGTAAIIVAVGYFILGAVVGELHATLRQWRRRKRHDT